MSSPSLGKNVKDLHALVDSKNKEIDDVKQQLRDLTQQYRPGAGLARRYGEAFEHRQVAPPGVAVSSASTSSCATITP